MRARALTAAVVACAVVLPAAAGADDAAAAKRSSRATKRLRPVAFDNCGQLVSYARRYASRAELAYSPGGSAPVDTIDAPFPPAQGGSEGTATDAPSPQAAPGAAAPIAPDSSSTNVQEQGVDEPDAVKTDGKTIFAIANGDLHAVDARSPQPRLLSTLALDGQGDQLLIHGRKLLVIGTRYVDIRRAPPGAARAARA